MGMALMVTIGAILLEEHLGYLLHVILEKKNVMHFYGLRYQVSQTEQETVDLERADFGEIWLQSW